jgi:hypothetical protein
MVMRIIFIIFLCWLFSSKNPKYLAIVVIKKINHTRIFNIMEEAVAGPVFKEIPDKFMLEMLEAVLMQR